MSAKGIAVTLGVRHEKWGGLPEGQGDTLQAGTRIPQIGTDERLHNH